ncbi:hypothetical protein TNCV_2041211 [Trichonephila clavipes]|nr:hypothetical protein TNCV_2041211 [Trichonephila clavipes]
MKSILEVDYHECIPNPVQGSLRCAELKPVQAEIVDLAKKINLEVDKDDVQELLDSHNQEMTMNEHIEMHEKEQDIEELESLDPGQSGDIMTVGNLKESLSLIDKGVANFRKYGF